MLNHIQQLSPGRGTFDYLHGCGTSWASSDVVQPEGIKIMSGGQEVFVIFVRVDGQTVEKKL